MTGMKHENLLGIDFGDRNIGVAFGLNGLTMPLPIISAGNLEVAISELVRIVFENKIGKIVVGMPATLEGKPTAQALKVKDFIKRMKIKIKLPVVPVNEHSSTKEALEKAFGLDISKKRRGNLDSLSAEIILKRYFEEAG